jgi:DNA-binding transcriptional LysR family regulator
MPRSRLRRYFRHGLLPQLIAFEACLRLGGVTRAADELSLAQPTVSGLIRKLTETVGEPLLVARGGRIRLTKAGQEVAALCAEMLGALNRYDERRSENPRAEIPTKIAPWSPAPEPPSPSRSPRESPTS